MNDRDDFDFDLPAGEEEVDREGGGVDDRYLVDPRDNRRQRGRDGMRRNRSTTEDDYGCEVLTFGRVDHCAMGVPGVRGGGGAGGLTTKGSSQGCHKPRRVELFGVGELRRKWTSSTTSPTTTTTTSSIDARLDNDVDSPAIAVAASTHHTLVLTRSGRLFAFGYGKSGRLGVGDARNRNLPVRVLGQLSRRVVTGIAAAVDHSLCCTEDGEIFSWGSNGFGQLGHLPGGADRDVDAVATGRLSPRRVEGGGGFRQSFVVAVAAGDRHSVALTRMGEVYCWGDNRSGQLGIYCNNGDVGAISSSDCGLRPRRLAIAIAAAEFSTLVLTMPPTMPKGGGRASSSVTALPVNSVFGWGHGNHSVMRVVFPPTEASGGNSPRRAIINPTAIACAKYHNVAIMVDGAVYTWGLQRDCLGIEKSPAAAGPRVKQDDSEWATSEGRRTKSKKIGGLNVGISTASSMISSPQLVVGLLPENGGGKAVAVSASESHTAVVTSDGHLFTWGTSVGNDVLGHKGVKYLEIPKKVKRVHRAVGVAAAKEHTVLLMATSFPRLPAAASTCLDLSTCTFEPLSLQECAAIEISRNVDLFNVLPIAIVARRLNCAPLMRFCDEFIRKNLDGVLAVGNKNDFTTFISTWRFAFAGEIHIDFEPDGSFHPFFYHIANSNTGDSCAMLKKCAGRIMHQCKKAKRTLIGEDKHRSTASVSREQDGSKNDDCEQKCVPLNISLKKMATSSNNESAGLSCLKAINNAQSQLPLNLLTEKRVTDIKSTRITNDTPKFRCEVCNVLCPDCDSLSLHMNGRKHRNRLAHLKANEEKIVAETMMEKKRMQLIEKSFSDNGGDNFAVSTDQRMKTCNRSLVNNTTTAWASNAVTSLKPSGTNIRSKSFHDILTEEQQRSLKVTAPTNKLISSPVSSKRPTLSRASTTIYHTQARPTVDHSQKIYSPVTGSVQSLPLSAFIKKSGNQKTIDIAGSPESNMDKWLSAGKTKSGSAVGWGVKPDCTLRPHRTVKSFAAIQKEEEFIRSNEDHMSRIEGNQWFVQQRERAASIGEIQEQERKDRELLDLIEEQKQIEKDIIERGKQETTNIHIKKQKRKLQKKRVKNCANATLDQYPMP
ncbi:hypothetical protein ACHAXA_011739 [Cyclostephanos tholiformis]|uniref:RCC1-like domain-containing protein n=1 Tax=Cyclostephanos tholiformis TaxID=382380 RepID=A0ABD3R324_9STRA